MQSQLLAFVNFNQVASGKLSALAAVAALVVGCAMVTS
jgi:hypothetical protein